MGLMLLNCLNKCLVMRVLAVKTRALKSDIFVPCLNNE